MSRRPLPTKTCKQLADGARICETRQLAGDGGIYQTLYMMRDLARRDAKDERVIRLARDLRGSTDEQTVWNIWEHMVDNYPYQSDPDDHEFVAAPIHTLSEAFNDQYPHRDCDDLSTAFACLLKASGAVQEQYFKAIAWRKHDYTHVYNLVRLPTGEFIPIDLVMAKHGFGAEKKPQIRAMHIKI
jgi:hypothetical protein